MSDLLSTRPSGPSKVQQVVWECIIYHLPSTIEISNAPSLQHLVIFTPADLWSRPFVHPTFGALENPTGCIFTQNCRAESRLRFSGRNPDALFGGGIQNGER